MDRTQQMAAGEVALEANVSTRTVYRWIDRGFPKSFPFRVVSDSKTGGGRLGDRPFLFCKEPL